MPEEQDLPITEEWLKASGFLWQQGERQPAKHWVLKLGWAVDGGRFSCADDLQIEVTPAWWFNARGERVQAAEGDPWHCWLKGEGRGFLHIRHLGSLGALILLIEALTGIPWRSENVRFGVLHTQVRADALRAQEAPHG